MMSEYPLMPSDSTPESSLALALALKDKLSPPHQSNFRVFCVMPFVDLDDHTLRYVTGTNAEACALHSSFCAERTALVTLRNHPRGFERLANVKALYIVCDGPTEITPGARVGSSSVSSLLCVVVIFVVFLFSGLLCREMLSSFIPMETPIWLGARADDGAIIQRCMTLAELLPFPHVYRGLRSSEIPPRFHQHRELYPIARLVADLIAESSSIVSEQQLLLLANSVHAAIADDASTVHFAHIAAGVLFADGTVFATSQDKGLEYSTSLPADVKVCVVFHSLFDFVLSL
jgi:cytidine deaminase